MENKTDAYVALQKILENARRISGKHMKRRYLRVDNGTEYVTESMNR